MSLIAADDMLALGAVIFGLAFLGFWADSHPVARRASGPLWVIASGLLLSNLGLIPSSAPLYDFVGANLVPMAIPLLLFKADFRRIARESGRLLVIFIVAAVGVSLGAIGGYYLLGLGELGARVAGVYAAGFTGGTVNFVAVSQMMQLSPSEFSAALSANTPVSVMALMWLMAMPAIPFLRRMIPSAIIEATGARRSGELAGAAPPALKLKHLSGAVALSFLICWLGFAIAARYLAPQYSLLVVTVLTLLIANGFASRLRALEGEFELGMLVMYVFFAVVGAGTDITAFLDSALDLFVLSILIVVIQSLFVLAAAKLFGFDLAEVVIASAANFVGPAPAAAIATGWGWRLLVMPGIMCGILGYAIANFIGLGISTLLAP